MRGVPDHSTEPPSVPPPATVTVVSPTLSPKEPLPERLVGLGHEVLDLVPRKQRGSLDAYCDAAHGLSRVLKVAGVRVTPRMLFYLALRVKWIADTTTAKAGTIMAEDRGSFRCTCGRLLCIPEYALEKSHIQYTLTCDCVRV